MAQVVEHLPSKCEALSSKKIKNYIYIYTYIYIHIYIYVYIYIQFLPLHRGTVRRKRAQMITGKQYSFQGLTYKAKEGEGEGNVRRGGQ
jgi:hypothetical protein